MWKKEKKERKERKQAKKKRNPSKSNSMAYAYAFLLLFYMCYACNICLHTTCVPGMYRDQKRVLDSLELKLQMVVSHHVDSGNRTWVSGTTVTALNHRLISSVKNKQTNLKTRKKVMEFPDFLFLLQNFSISGSLNFPENFRIILPISTENDVYAYEWEEIK